MIRSPPLITQARIAARCSSLKRAVSPSTITSASSPSSAAGAGASALQLLERRKHTKPSSVVVLEALSQLLPDHTYVTEFRVDGEKLQVVGLTRDAPSLIELIEQSPHFARATFFAPTTRSPSDPGERFHIEARIEPVNAPRT